MFCFVRISAACCWFLTWHIAIVQSLQNTSNRRPPTNPIRPIKNHSQLCARARKTHQTNQSLSQTLSPFSRSCQSDQKALSCIIPDIFHALHKRIVISTNGSILCSSVSGCSCFFSILCFTSIFLVVVVIGSLVVYFCWWCYASFAMQSVHSIPFSLAFRVHRECFDIKCCCVSFFFYIYFACLCILFAVVVIAVLFVTFYFCHIFFFWKLHKKCENVTKVWEKTTTKKKKKTKNRQTTTTKISVMYL